jgi:hypothetical protein
MAVTAAAINDAIGKLMVQREETRAEVMVHLWTCLSKVLISMLGLPAFVSVYESNLYRTQSTFPSLRKGDDGLYDLTFNDLKISIEEMSENNAENCSIETLRAFIVLLNSLVGEKITTNILIQCWGKDIVESMDQGK